MDIKYALLGFLSWQPFSGYDLKKKLESFELFYWSGNNNQIYTSLVQMHKDGLVEAESRPSEKMLNRKIYRITPAGSSELKRWLYAEPEMPQLRKPFLIRLAWAQALSDAEIISLLDRYEYELQMKLIMFKEEQKRGKTLNPARTERERYLWQSIHENYVRNYGLELEWVQEVKRGWPDPGR